MLRIFLALWLAISPVFAWAGSMTLLGVGKVGTTAPSTTTWNTTDNSGNIARSNGNLTLTSSFSGFETVRSVASHSTGKFFAELVWNPLGGGALAGTANGTFVPNAYTGSDSNSVGAWTSSTTLFGGGGIGSNTTWASADVVDIAIDLGAQLIWQRTNGGNWNASGTANPATGTGGNSFSGIGAGPYFFSVTLQDSGDVVIANFGATAYSFTPPAGFGNW